MMQNFSSLKKIFSLRRSGEPEPTRDWLLMLAAASIGLFVILIWQWWVFDQVVEGGFRGPNTERSAQEAERAETLETQLETWYRERAAEEAKYIQGEYSYIDPSQ